MHVQGIWGRGLYGEGRTNVVKLGMNDNWSLYTWSIGQYCPLQVGCQSALQAALHKTEVVYNHWTGMVEWNGGME